MSIWVDQHLSAHSVPEGSAVHLAWIRRIPGKPPPDGDALLYSVRSTFMINIKTAVRAAGVHVHVRWPAGRARATPPPFPQPASSATRGDLRPDLRITRACKGGRGATQPAFRRETHANAATWSKRRNRRKQLRAITIRFDRWSAATASACCPASCCGSAASNVRDGLGRVRPVTCE